VYSAVALQVVWSLGLASCFGCVFIYISASSPNRASLGATNGLAQLLVSIMRAIGPAASTSLFSLSFSEGNLGGGMVYLVLLGISLVAVVFGTTLPKQAWLS